MSGKVFHYKQTELATMWRGPALSEVEGAHAREPSSRVEPTPHKVRDECSTRQSKAPTYTERKPFQPEKPTPNAKNSSAVSKNQLYFGDNLAVLRERTQDESVDLIYLDPPFNSRQDYNVLFAEA